MPIMAPGEIYGDQTEPRWSIPTGEWPLGPVLGIHTLAEKVERGLIVVVLPENNGIRGLF